MKRVGEQLMDLVQSVQDESLGLIAQYRSADERLKEALLKQALDAPHRARARLEYWIAEQDIAKRSNARSYLDDCLAAAGSTKTLAEIKDDLLELERHVVRLAVEVKGKELGWEDAAAEIESAFSKREEPIDLAKLPLPPNYRTIFDEPY